MRKRSQYPFRVASIDGEALPPRRKDRRATFGGGVFAAPPDRSDRNHLKMIMNSLPVMIVLFDREMKRVDLNSEFTRLTGWTDADMAGHNVMELCYPNPDYRRKIAEFIESGESGWRDFRVTAKNGEAIDSSWAHIRIDNDLQLCLGIDIRGRVKVEQEQVHLLSQIENEREKFRTIVNSIADEVWFCDALGREVLLNPSSGRGRTLDGQKTISPEEPPADRIEVIFPNGTPRPQKDSPLLLSLRGEIHSGDELARDLATGKLRYRHYHSAPVRNRTGAIIGAVAVVSDITGRKMLENTLQRHARDLEVANMELESFSFSVSHDLRNFLNNIVAMTGVLEEFYFENLDADGRRCIREIGANTEKMASVIESLLRLSRVSQQELKLQEVSLSEMAQSIIEELRKNEKREKTMVVIQPHLRAEADPDLIYIALANLIGNAWKYTCKLGDASIEIGCVPDNPHIFFIRDNGIGFDMKDRDHLFTPFHRLHRGSEFPGSGLGLPIVERIIRRHSGRIWAEGEPGKGAVFYFTLSGQLPTA
jgi:PAS domain S-box-containing protein